MTVSIGSITLNSSLVLRGISDSQDIAINDSVTLMGGVNIQTAPIQAGKEITLTTTSKNGLRGYFTRQQVEDIRDLQTTATSTTLIHPMGTFTVFIRSLGEFTPIKEYSNGGPTDVGAFSFKMITL